MRRSWKPVPSGIPGSNPGVGVFLVIFINYLGFLILMNEAKKKKGKKKRNPLDDVLDDLEDYDEGCKSHDMMSSGEWSVVNLIGLKEVDVLIV